MPKTPVSVRAGRRGRRKEGPGRRCSRRRSEHCLEGGLLQQLEPCLREHFLKSITVSTRQGFGDSWSYRLLLLFFFFIKKFPWGQEGNKEMRPEVRMQGEGSHIIT